MTDRKNSAENEPAQQPAPLTKGDIQQPFEKVLEDLSIITGLTEEQPGDGEGEMRSALRTIRSYADAGIKTMLGNQGALGYTTPEAATLSGAAGGSTVQGERRGFDADAYFADPKAWTLETRDGVPVLNLRRAGAGKAKGKFLLGDLQVGGESHLTEWYGSGYYFEEGGTDSDLFMRPVAATVVAPQSLPGDPDNLTAIIEALDVREGGLWGALKRQDEAVAKLRALRDSISQPAAAPSPVGDAPHADTRPWYMGGAAQGLRQIADLTDGEITNLFQQVFESTIAGGGEKIEVVEIKREDGSVGAVGYCHGYRHGFSLHGEDGHHGFWLSSETGQMMVNQAKHYATLLNMGIDCGELTDALAAAKAGAAPQQGQGDAQLLGSINDSLGLLFQRLSSTIVTDQVANARITTSCEELLEMRTAIANHKASQGGAQSK